MSNIFIPPQPILPPKIMFNDFENSVKMLKQSADWYRGYAEYLDGLCACENFSECVVFTDSIDWNILFYRGAVE